MMDENDQEPSGKTAGFLIIPPGDPQLFRFPVTAE
jgi:hypothetical protein